MSEIKLGRWTAVSDAPFVVFVIGMRFNALWKVHKWGPVVAAMPRMLAELQRQPELGYLGGGLWFGRTTVLVQYWRSFEHLETYARARDHAHLPAWAAFNRAIGASRDVGVYHETYRVNPGDYETIYVNMPPTLLGGATRLVEATGKREAARSRLDAGG